MLYDWPLNRRVVPRLVWASSTGANKPTLERLRRPRPQRVNWLVSSTTCLKTSSPTKNLTRLATNYDSKNPPSVNSKGRPLLWAIHCCQPPPFPHNSPVHIFKFLRSEHDAAILRLADETKAALPFVQLAFARAEVALDAAVI